MVLARATQAELAQMVDYLKTENRILRSKLPKRVDVTPAERDPMPIARNQRRVEPVVFLVRELGILSTVHFVEQVGNAKPSRCAVSCRDRTGYGATGFWDTTGAATPSFHHELRTAFRNARAISAAVS
jgi:hypothetical protein